MIRLPMPTVAALTFNLHSLGLLTLMLGCCAALLAGLVIWRMARNLIRPPRMTDAKALYLLQRLSPEDLGLGYETMRFKIQPRGPEGEIVLAAWWMPSAGPSSQTVVLVHGYADAKVGSIAWAPGLHALNCNVLAIDLRAHGESGGQISTAGFYERHDLIDVINQLRAARAGDARSVVVFALSVGGLAASGAAALAPESVDGLIIDSPIADFRTATRQHLRFAGLPSGWIATAALWLAQRFSRARFDNIRLSRTLMKFAAPILILSPGADPLIAREDVDEIAALIPPARGTVHRADGALHLLMASQEAERYWAMVKELLDRAR